MPCPKCSSDYNLLNWRIRCGECEIRYCNKCVRRKEGVLYCEVCLVLMQRPPDRDQLMELKSKELKDYLNRHNVNTHGLVEKQDLVDLFCHNYIPEKQRKTFDKFTANFGDSFKPITSILSNLDFVIEGHKPSEQPQQQQQPSEERPTTSQVAFFSSSPIPERRPHLEDIKTIEDLDKLSPKELKILLTINRVEFKGCIEKSDLLEYARRLWEDSNKSKGVDDMPFDDLCKLCMDAPLDCVLLECGHITTCIECGKKLAECPICRRFVVRVVRTFKA